MPAYSVCVNTQVLLLISSQNVIAFSNGKGHISVKLLVETFLARNIYLYIKFICVHTYLHIFICVYIFFFFYDKLMSWVHQS